MVEAAVPAGGGGGGGSLYREQPKFYTLTKTCVLLGIIHKLRHDNAAFFRLPLPLVRFRQFLADLAPCKVPRYIATISF